MALPWFRFYSEALKDRKITRICNLTNQPKAIVIGVWATLLALGNDSPERGCLMIAEGYWLTLAEIQTETGLDTATFDNIMLELDNLGMIHNASEDGYSHIIITNFHKRNFKSDDSAPRVRKHRAKTAETVTGNTDETPQGNVTPSLQKHNSNALDSDTDQDTESESDTEKDGASKNRTPPPPPPPKSRKKPKKPIPLAVQVFRDAAHRFPAKSWWGKVARIVGEAEADLTFWRQVVEAYVGCGWNPTNVKTMLEDFYQKRKIPTVGKQRKKQLGQFTDVELEEARRESLAEKPIDPAAFLGEGA